MHEPVLNRIVAVVGRMLGWGMLGASCGVALGLLAGLLHLPPDRPGEPLANEWYPVAVIFMMFYECCAGFVLGAAIAAVIPWPSARQKAFLLAMAGAALGMGTARLLPNVGDDAIMLSMFSQAGGVLVVLAVGALWWARFRPLPKSVSRGRGA